MIFSDADCFAHGVAVRKELLCCLKSQNGRVGPIEHIGVR